ncbi:DUF2163 domain-containing protein [Variovorax sp. J22R193]|uniref:DUF2163 domain-containing protein n=1 Tax=Variovorax fucosicus TaxID=3053517 RepID=UPI0025760059|nr:DUF2163 domain-containing protein [Variovorax sp. J22R193]MDM0041884.1 DUF2163 domain-containing protein [Variovorax sp. J22R193]
MKTIPIALRNEFAKGSTTRAWCWYFEQKGGAVFTVTTWSRDLLIDGLIYKAKDGVNPMAIESTADGAVSNSEITGALSDDFVTEEQIVGGIWDNCFVTVFEVNARDLTMGRMSLVSGWLGQLSCGRMDFKAELRSLAQALQQTIGDVYQPMCRARLGDSMCKVDVEALRVTSTLTAVTSRRTFTDSARGEASDWFGAGLFRVLAGPYTGMEMEVYAFAAGVFTLSLPLPFDPTVWPAYSVVPGCRKRHERGGLFPAGISDCRDKFNNVINFQGEWPAGFPGNNRILGLGSMVGQQS